MIRSRKSVSLALFVPLVLGTGAPLAAQSAGLTETGYAPLPSTAGHMHVGELGELALVLERSLKCSCGCGLDTHSCQFQMQCGTSPVWSERIRRSLEAGETVEAIQASFVADFGATVLMAPPPEGFNLVGYLLPAVAIVTAGMFIGLFLRGRAAGQMRPTSATELGEQDAERLRAAMRQLDEAEGPDW